MKLSLIEFESMIGQLDFAVHEKGGKTTITKNDLRILEAALYELKTSRGLFIHQKGK